MCIIIYKLFYLQELNLENNRLKKLPVNFAKLLNLRKLNLKGYFLLLFLDVCFSGYFPPQVNVLCPLHEMYLCRKIIQGDYN